MVNLGTSLDYTLVTGAGSGPAELCQCKGERMLACSAQGDLRTNASLIISITNH